MTRYISIAVGLTAAATAALSVLPFGWAHIAAASLAAAIATTHGATIVSSKTESTSK